MKPLKLPPAGHEEEYRLMTFIIQSVGVSAFSLFMCVHMLCLSVRESAGGDTYLLRQERDDLSTDGAETLDNLRL